MYIEYDRARESLMRAITKYDGLIGEKERLFQRTQPRAVDYQADRVKSSSRSNALESYVAAIEGIDKKLEEAKEIVEHRKKLMDGIEVELRKSKDIYDVVYVLRYLEHWRIRKIARATTYSESQIYRILQNMRVNARFE